MEKTVSKSGCRGDCTLDIPGMNDRNYLFTLTGFEFKFPHTEKNVRRIRVWPLEGTLRSDRLKVTFRDNSDDNDYDVKVSYVLIPRPWVKKSAVAELKGEGADVAWLGSEHSGPGRINIIAGVDFRYTDEDEHLKRFAIDLTDGDARAVFTDNDGEEDFKGEVLLHLLCPAKPVDNAVIEEC